MKILFCVATMGPGGAERQIVHLSEALTNAGCEVHVLLIRGGPNLDALEKSGATVHFLRVFPDALQFFYPIARKVRSIRPDVLYVWQRPFDVLGAIVGLALGVPVVHAERTDPGKVPYGFKVFLRNLLVPKAAGVIANSKSGEKYWRERVDANRVCRIQNIIPYEKLESVRPSPEADGALVAVGRLDAGKNVNMLLEALAHLRGRGVIAPALIVGDGSDAAVMSTQAQLLGIQDQVRFTGYRRDSWNIMAGARAYISLSRYEGAPNSVMEAEALGCPMVLSDIPAHRHLMPKGRVLFADPSSIHDIASAIEAIMSIDIDPPAKNRSGVGVAEIRIREDQTSASIAASHLEFFRRVLALSNEKQKGGL
jgi:GalNAc-alpha-(1->4)-GalNAc-alpha-(1->3)-diNAcBac-PP-undecaprenol alpha-1,4-N-acetyl-D-galactosaminyltransferase